MATAGVKGGSTLVTVLLKGGKLHYLSVGDSRIYLLRDGALGKLNRAHNYCKVLKEQTTRGEVDPEEPYVNPRKDALTRLLSIPAPDAAQNIESAVLGQNLRHQDNFTAILIDYGRRS